jgi:hypothetical protein
MNQFIRRIASFGTQHVCWSFMDSTSAENEVRIESHMSSVDSDNWTDTGVRMAVLGHGNFSQSSYSAPLQHFLRGNLENPYRTTPIENSDLLYAMCVYAYGLADLDERRRIAYVESVREYQGDEVYFYIDFDALARVIRNNMWNIYQVETPNNPPFSLQCADHTENPVEWGEEAVYTIGIDDNLLDEAGHMVIFLSAFDESDVLDELSYENQDVLRIDGIRRLITSYIYHGCSLVEL